jgi:RimJ/RimL family protein N-acetyltransferase
MMGITDPDGARRYGRELLTGGRVRLRGLREDDLTPLAAWYADPAFAATNSTWVAPQSEAAAKARFADWSANQHDEIGFVVETLDEPPVLIGHVGIWGARPKDRCATLGIGLGLDYVGRGYGTDALRVMVDYGFREIGLHRIQLEVLAFNTVAIRAYTKAGFVEEGRRRAAVFHDGEWHDEVLMAVIETEWRRRQTSG